MRSSRRTLNMRMAARVVVIFALMLLADARSVHAEELPAPGITVSGAGMAKGKPSLIEINATIVGDGELAADASVKHRDTRRRVFAAIQGLNNPSLAIESKGLSVNQVLDPAVQQRVVIAGALATDMGKQKVAVVEQLRLVLKDADKLDQEKLIETVLKVIDVGRDNGMIVGSSAAQPMQTQPVQAMLQPAMPAPSMISFRLADPAPLREAAYKQAVEDARAKASRLADMAGVKLGRIVSIVDQDSGGGSVTREAPAGINTATMEEVLVNVRLLVQFEIVK